MFFDPAGDTKGIHFHMLLFQGVLDITREQCDTKLESPRLESLVSHCSRVISDVSNKHTNYHFQGVGRKVLTGGC